MQRGPADSAHDDPGAGAVLEREEQVSALLLTCDDHWAELCTEAFTGAIPSSIHRVLSVSQFRQALDSERYDVALIDERIGPGEAGEDFALPPGIPVVVLSMNPVSGSKPEPNIWDRVGSQELQRLPQVAQQVFEIKRLRNQIRAAQNEQRIYLAEAEKADQALRQSENRFRALVEKSSDAISLVDAQGKVLYSSHAVSPIFGYTLDERKGKSIFELVHPEDIEQTLSIFGKLLANPFTSDSTQIRYRHKDGTWRWIEALATNLLEEPSVKAVVINYRDITEKRQLIEQLFQAQKMEAVGRLAGGVAHDFNNLLTAILGYSDMVLEKAPQDGPLHRYASEIKKAGGRAAALTRQLLAFSRLQVMAPQVLDLNTVILEMEKMLKRVIGEDIQLVAAPAAAPARIKADPSQIEQVILNLAINARDAMPKGGTLALKVSNGCVDKGFSRGGIKVQPGDYVILEVTDTGCGMDAEVRSRAFEPFFTTKEKGKGTGLGLSTVYGIIKQSGGYIWLDSEPGRGAAFSIYLPKAGEAILTAADSESAAHPRSGDEAILIVEDDAAVRNMLKQILRSGGYEVLEAKDGEEALKLCAERRHAIHLTLTDVVMPQMSGRELARRIRSVHPETRVLFMTGYAGSRVGSAEVLDEDAHFIEKPFSADAIATRVRSILDAD